MNTNGNAASAAPPTGRAGQSNVTELVSGILDDAQTLIRQQFAMLRAEVKEDVNKAAQAGKLLGIGVGAASVGMLFIAIGCVYLLNWFFPDLAPFACWMIVGGFFALFGMTAFFIGRQRLTTVSPIADKTRNALRENISWITNHPT